MIDVLGVVTMNLYSGTLTGMIEGSCLKVLRIAFGSSQREDIFVLGRTNVG